MHVLSRLVVSVADKGSLIDTTVKYFNAVRRLLNVSAINVHAYIEIIGAKSCFHHHWCEYMLLTNMSVNSTLNRFIVFSLCSGYNV